jgi:hypothetical protein
MDRRKFTQLLTLSGLAIAAASGPALASGKKAEGGEGEKGKKKPDGSYLTVGLVTASIMRSSGRRSVLAIETGIDIPDPKLYEKASRLTPRLQAAYVQPIQIYAANLSPTKVPDADYISRELQRQTDVVVGAPGVRLLLGSIMVN